MNERNISRFKRALAVAGICVTASVHIGDRPSVFGWFCSASYAKDGGSGGGSGSGSSGGSDSSSGSGSNSGSGGSGSNSGSSGSGSGHSGRSGDEDNSGKGSSDDNGGKRDRAAVGRYLEVLRGHGAVIQSRKSGRTIEVRYSDGWRETVSANRYRLFDARNRRVIERAARADDFERLGAVSR